MRKQYLIFFICVFISFFLIFNCFAKSNNKQFVTAQSAILVDLNKNKILYSKDIHTKRAPASTIKILAALVALEKIGTNTDVKISKTAVSVEPTKIWLAQGAKYNSLDLINAILISSANDASIALAEAVSGSEPEFAKIMTKKARQLGAKNSNFKNASGLPKKNQYSTAYDLYRIVKAAFKNSVIYQTMKKKKEKIKGTLGKEITLTNHNKMLFRKAYPLVLVKTGYTKSARHCFAGVVYFGKRKYAIVILKSRKPWTDIENLLGLIES